MLRVGASGVGGRGENWARLALSAACLLVPLLIAVFLAGAAPAAPPLAAPERMDVPVSAPARVAPQTADSCTPGTTLLNPYAPPEQRTRVYTIVAAPLRHEIRPGLSVPAWAYNGSVPAPEIRGVQGELLRVVLCNRLRDPVTIHWHGYPVPWQEDGVAGLTQDAVAPGATYTYEFRLTVAGSYWYHSHQDSNNQVDRGLYGMFVVAPPDNVAPDVEREVVLADDAGNALYTGEDDVISSRVGSTRAIMRTAWTLNGRAYPHGETLRVQQGQTVLLRVLNVGMYSHKLKLGGHLYRVVAVDGQAVHEPQLTDATLSIGSGERYDILFSAANPGSWSLRSIDDDSHAAEMRLPIIYADYPDAPGPEDTGWQPYAQPLDLTSYGTPDPNAALPIDATFNRNYTLQLGRNTQTGGWQAGLGEGDQPPTDHSGMDMGGQVMMNTTLQPGDLVTITIHNNSDSEHPIHIHGHFFRLLSLDNRPYTGAPIMRDTATVPPHSTLVVGFSADNPGVWMIHCHILWHAAMGMGIHFNYAGVETPFVQGGSHNNKSE